jgi:hypothetical protein
MLGSSFPGNGSQNLGSCAGPNCHSWSSRCSSNFCRLCCEKIHDVTDAFRAGEWHVRPWGADRKIITSVPIEPSKPAVPEPTDLEEITDGDWTLGSKTYYI